MKILTNNRPRDLVCLADVPAKARADFDYISGEDEFSPRMVKYRGSWYDVNEYQTTRGMPDDSPLKAWNGYQGDSFFSGTLVRYAPGTDFECVIMARWYC